MAVTKIADVIVPELFAPYVIRRTMELSAILSSPAVERTAEFDMLASSPSHVVNLPYWQDLTGADELLSDSSPLTAGSIAAGVDVAAILRRGRAWGANDLAANLSGDDPMRAIADLVAGYWARRLQTAIINVLAGAFGTTAVGASMASLTHDISAAADGKTGINALSTVDAIQKLGDAKDNVAVILMHSATEAALAKQALIVYQPANPASAGQTDRIPTYLGKRVIVDDSLPASQGVYTSYILGAGAIAYGEGSPTGHVPVEVAREALAGNDLLITRRACILHFRGVAWTPGTGVPAAASPANTELADKANWSRKYELKAVRGVRFIHKLADTEVTPPVGP